MDAVVLDTSSSFANPTSSETGNSRGNAIIPPYWHRRRGNSQASIRSDLHAPITLEDHTEEPSDQSEALWAKSVHIDDYVVVSGSRTGVGAYVVYNCTVEMLDVGILFASKNQTCAEMP